MISKKRWMTTPGLQSCRSPLSATWGILLLSSLLTGCVTSKPAAPASLSQSLLYSPPVLRLPAGKPVQTVDGIYTPMTDEIWHSDARFRTEEQQVIDATTALNELKNR